MILEVGDLDGLHGHIWPYLADDVNLPTEIDVLLRNDETINAIIDNPILDAYSHIRGAVTAGDS